MLSFHELTSWKGDKRMSKGKITVITGPMFSEKSGELISRCMKLEQFGGKSVKAYKPSEDIRFSTDEIVSRTGLRYPATNIPKLLPTAVVEQILNETENVSVVAFDEAQFFKKPIMYLVEELAYRGKHVIIDGLNTDYRGKEFGYMGGLLAIADEIERLYAFCAVCKSEDAIYTQRFESGIPAKLGAIVQLGDSESYEPRCRSCYVPPHKVS